MRDLNAFLRVSDKWDREYYTALSSAIIQRKGLKHGSRLINKYLSRERRLDFNLVNPHSRKIMRRELLIAASALERRLYRPGTVVMLASFVDRAWACCDRSITFDLHAAKQKVRNALAGMNYIAVFEPAVYPDLEFELDDKTGDLISFHCHSLWWDTSESKIRRQKKNIKERFEHVDEAGEGKTYPHPQSAQDHPGPRAHAALYH